MRSQQPVREHQLEFAQQVLCKLGREKITEFLEHTEPELHAFITQRSFDAVANLELNGLGDKEVAQIRKSLEWTILTLMQVLRPLSRKAVTESKGTVEAKKASSPSQEVPATV